MVSIPRRNAHLLQVYITINDVPVEDLYMQLGEAGEAVFVEEDVVR